MRGRCRVCDLIVARIEKRYRRLDGCGGLYDPWLRSQRGNRRLRGRGRRVAVET